MTTKSVDTTATGRFPFAGKLSALMGLMIFAAATPAARADIPDRAQPKASGLSGYYKVASSTDPFFSMEDREWFLDFGSQGKTAGNVAVSLRQNPVVRVRRLVWQFYPQTSTLTLGAQTEEGSKQAVAVANWQVRPSPGGVILERANYQIFLTRALASD